MALNATTVTSLEAKTWPRRGMKLSQLASEPVAVLSPDEAAGHHQRGEGHQVDRDLQGRNGHILERFREGVVAQLRLVIATVRWVAGFGAGTFVGLPESVGLLVRLLDRRLLRGVRRLELRR